MIKVLHELNSGISLNELITSMIIAQLGFDLIGLVVITILNYFSKLVSKSTFYSYIDSIFTK
jgi:hypothetical protein